MTHLPLVLALHAQDILAIAAVLLVWVGLRRLSGRSRQRRNRPPGRDRPGDPDAGARRPH